MAAWYDETRGPRIPEAIAADELAAGRFWSGLRTAGAARIARIAAEGKDFSWPRPGVSTSRARHAYLSGPRPRELPSPSIGRRMTPSEHAEAKTWRRKVHRASARLRLRLAEEQAQVHRSAQAARETAVGLRAAQAHRGMRERSKPSLEPSEDPDLIRPAGMSEQRALLIARIVEERRAAVLAGEEPPFASVAMPVELPGSWRRQLGA